MMLLGTFIAICCIHVSHAALINGDALADELKTIARDGMGVTAVQKFYDQQTYDRKPVSGVELLDQISKTLEDKFTLLIDAATNIRNKVQEEYKNFEQELSQVGIQQCCEATGVKSNTKFSSEVKLGESCVTLSSSSPPDRKFPNKKVEEVMKKNYEQNSNLLWQYYGSEDGTSIYYPKVKVKDCKDYDPRLRPFYSSAASPQPKDVVLVIDKSSSMDTQEQNGKSRLYIAREITRTVIDTLNQNDRIGLVAFDEDAHTPKSTDTPCYDDTLAIATEKNKENLITFTYRLTTKQGSNYGAALTSAFKFFSSSSLDLNGENRDQMILFLTDGIDINGGKHPLEVIKTENEKLENRVYMMTFGIGKDIAENQKALDLLKNMSRQVYNNASYGTIKTGFSEIIKDETHLRSKMSVYYGFFPSTHNPSYSVPFLDTFSNIGLVISVCLPTYGNDVFLGVACTDIKLSDIFAEVTIFNQDEMSYIFVIDKSGRTLHHPLLPVPRTIKEDVTMPNIVNLERSSKAKEAIDSMKRMESGNKTLTSTRTVARGKVLYDGILTRSVESHYFWKPIPNSVYCLCVVVGNGDVKQTMHNLEPSDEVFLYNRRDLSKDNFPSCTIVNRWSTKDRAAIHFNSNAFKNPSLYHDYEETEVEVERYKNYFTKKGAINPGFKDGVFNSLVASYQAEDFWKKHSNLATFAIWRFMGTTAGVFRTYPHHVMPKDYDHEFRPWWTKAMSNKGVLVVTTPYLDASGSGIITSLCHTIYKGSNKEHTPNDKAEGVIGWDVSLPYLNYLILQSYPVCKDITYSCMLIDDSGFLIVHPDFVDPINTDRTLQTVHIVVKEGDIAEDLLNKGIMTKNTCSDLENFKIQKTYRVELLQGSKGVDQMSGNTNLNYELWPVTGTNVFIIIKKKIIDTKQCCQKTSLVSPEVVLCAEKSCDCLCHSKIPFNRCLFVNEVRDIGNVCSAKAPSLQTTINVELEKEKIQGLPLCFDPMCSSRETEFDCFKVVGCSWCVVTKAHSLCERPYCGSWTHCPFGVITDSSSCSADNNYITTTEEEAVTEEENADESNLTLTIGVSLSVVIVILVIIIGVIVYLKVCKSRCKPEDDYMTPTSDYLTAIPRDPGVGITNTQLSSNEPDVLEFTENIPQIPKGHPQTCAELTMQDISDNVRYVQK